MFPVARWVCWLVVPIACSRDTTSEIDSWLLLRAAATTVDSAARARMYEHVTVAPARARIGWVEARAREQFGDTTGAIRAYAALGARVNVLRLQGSIARTAAESAAVRQALLRTISAVPDGETVREGYAVFDRFFQATPVEQLAIARAATAVGSWGRARTGFAASIGTASSTPHDQFSYATALARLNQDRDAAAQYARVTGPRPLVAAAKYQRARALLATADVARAQRELRALAAAYPSDTSAAAALALLADLACDASNDRQARQLFQLVARRFPHSRFAAPARFQAALTAFVLGDPRTAAAEFGDLAKRGNDVAARYWLGRSLAALGRSAEAASTWRQLLAIDSTSYYAVLAGDQLGTSPVHDMHDPVVYPHVSAVDSAAQRMALLRERGMDPELRFESDWLFRTGMTERNRLLATAAAFVGTEQSGKAIALGWRALTEYGATPAVYRLVYPLAAQDTLAAISRRYGIDPILVASLIRQESDFNPYARSPVGARGLMQLMPNVAQSIAASLGIRPWSADRLYEPAVNVTLGVAHLAPLLHQHVPLVRVLAAYNAGEARVARWERKRGADDPELFTERIPFPETREYVKNIVRNREFYRALYTW